MTINSPQSKELTLEIEGFWFQAYDKEPGWFELDRITNVSKADECELIATCLYEIEEAAMSEDC